MKTLPNGLVMSADVKAYSCMAARGAGSFPRPSRLPWAGDSALGAPDVAPPGHFRTRRRWGHQAAALASTPP